MKTVLITGGAGFLGSILKKSLLIEGFICVSLDLVEDNFEHPNLINIKGDIRDIGLLKEIFSKYCFDIIFHCAAILAHAVSNKSYLWTSNVDGTKNIADFAEKYKVKKIIFTSSNCLWGQDNKKPITEDEIPCPVEIYGESKLEGERILLDKKDKIKIIIFRCPTIIDSGRLGLLTILFEFIDEGKKVWVVGNGENLYQFIFAQDLVKALIKAIEYDNTDIFNIGSDKVKSFKMIYEYVIKKANTGAKIAYLPKKLTILGMELFYKLKLSPLGPYQYKMISSNFIFDTTKIKSKLNWKPTLSNEEMLYKAYEYYKENKTEIKNRMGVSAHRQAAKMGIIRLLKWIS